MPFNKRQAGIIMPIFSLPSEYGIGTFGQAAHDFAQFLSRSGQSLWQVLPLGPTGFGDSPYQSFSSFAGNENFIDLDFLCSDGLLSGSELEVLKTENLEYVNYNKINAVRRDVLRLAFFRSGPSLRDKIKVFCDENSDWIADYTLYMALKHHFGLLPWQDWPAPLRLREECALSEYRRALHMEIEFEYFLQYEFFLQFGRLKAKCKSLGIRLVGDLPIYAASDSADVWANQGQFLLDENGYPTHVAGVPPDYFSETGQLWGNPLYRWDEMERDGFAWWRRRISAAAKQFDVIRLDHFRGFESYWSVPSGSVNAVSGCWKPGPGKAFMDMLIHSFPDTDFIAEDLGIITPEVTALREYADLPGMSVLCFAFDPDNESTYLPHNQTRDTVCYAATHDNDTLLSWLNSAQEAERQFALDYCGAADSPVYAILRTGMASPACVFMAQLQDYLVLDNSARTNTPGTTGGNWVWRLEPGQLSNELEETLLSLTKIYCRHNFSYFKED